MRQRREQHINDVAIIRLEQFYPFPIRSLPAALAPYKNADVVWCQEEPENMGGWNFVDRRIEALLARLDLKARRPAYAGREAAASPATGLARTHNEQQAALVKAAIGAA